MPTEPLENHRHETFALLFAAGGISAAEAYKQAGYKCSKATAETEGPKLARSHQVSLRVEDLRQKAQEVAKEREGVTVLSIAEKRLFLARVMRTPVGQVTADSDLAQEVSVDDKTMKVKMVDKLRAIALDNDLAGDGSEADANSALSEALNRIKGISHGLDRQA